MLEEEDRIENMRTTKKFNNEASYQTVKMLMQLAKHKD